MSATLISERLDWTSSPLNLLKLFIEVDLHRSLADIISIDIEPNVIEKFSDTWRKFELGSHIKYTVSFEDGYSFTDTFSRLPILLVRETFVLTGSRIEQALQTLTTTSAAVDDYGAIQALYSEDARTRAWQIMRNNQEAYIAAYDLLREAGVTIRFDAKERRYVQIERNVDL